MFDLIVFQIETDLYTFVFNVHTCRRDKRRVPALGTVYHANGFELSQNEYDMLPDNVIPWGEAKRITQVIFR